MPAMWMATSPFKIVGPVAAVSATQQKEANLEQRESPSNIRYFKMECFDMHQDPILINRRFDLKCYRIRFSSGLNSETMTYVPTTRTSTQ